jgi:hypothetical protein
MCTTTNNVLVMEYLIWAGAHVYNKLNISVYLGPTRFYHATKQWFEQNIVNQIKPLIDQNILQNLYCLY